MSQFNYICIIGEDDLSADILEDLKQQLESNMKGILTNYGCFITGIRQSIIDQNISPVDFRYFLLNLNALDHDSEVKLLSDIGNELKELTTVTDMFEYLTIHKFISFLNYDIIECIIDKYGSDEDRREMEAYVVKVKAFVNKHKLAEFAEINPALKVHHTMEKTTLKVDIDEFQQLAKVFDLRRKLANILESRTSTLFLFDVKKGCVVVTFLIPRSVANIIFNENREFTMKQFKEFKDIEPIQWLECGDFRFDVTIKVSKLASIFIHTRSMYGSKLCMHMPLIVWQYTSRFSFSD